jgi:four helix bundle protein
MQITKVQNTKQYDLEDRTVMFAHRVRTFIKKLPRTISNIEDSKQLIRASGSVGANYIEANESLSKKDFVMRIKICRKEAKESRYWLKLMPLPSLVWVPPSCSSLIFCGKIFHKTRAFKEEKRWKILSCMGCCLG